MKKDHKCIKTMEYLVEIITFIISSLVSWTYSYNRSNGVEFYDNFVYVSCRRKFIKTMLFPAIYYNQR